MKKSSQCLVVNFSNFSNQLNFFRLEQFYKYIFSAVKSTMLVYK